MECKREEAAKAKGIAEKLLTGRDTSGAKKFALRAQSLFPGLEGLPQFMTTLDMYISAEKKINGEVDLYEVLGADPSADDETLRRKYKKLALALHPDKNKSVGAEGAFEILSKAWSLLSDKAMRAAYDIKRNLRSMDKDNKAQNASGAAGKNGLHRPTQNINSSVKNQTSTATPQPTPGPPPPSERATFWTACNRCRMQYQYLRIYLNEKLSCPNCKEPFHAVEFSAPPNIGQNFSSRQSSYQQWQNANSKMANNTSASGGKTCSAPNIETLGPAGVGSINAPTIQLGASPRPGVLSRMPASASSVGQNANAFQPTCPILKGGHKEPARGIRASKKTGTRLASSAGSPSVKGDRPMKKSRIEVNVSGAPNEMAAGNGGVGPVNVSGLHNGSSGTETLRTSSTFKRNSVRESALLEVRNMLVAKSRTSIRNKLNEWSREAALKVSHKDCKKMEMGKPEVALTGGRKDGSDTAEFVDPRNSIQPKTSSHATCNVDSVEKASEFKLMSVPDPDFYDFDKDRIEKSFGENQVWAAYDDDDGMPRYYAMVHGVISKRPFKMRISWLNSKSNAELGPLNWIGSGFPKTSGDFRVGKHVVYKNISSFSHRVKWMKGTRGVIQVFPKRGDVWALYRNWSPDWNELTPDEVVHKYDMVEVLEDYHKDQGVAVAPLVKVAGFKSVFHQRLDRRQVKTIPKGEMFRFSHQVPSYMLTGQEAQNAPKGCWELDPAALPLELLQVTTETREVETVDKSECAIRVGMIEDVKKTKEDLHLEESGKSTSKEKMVEDYTSVDGNDTRRIVKQYVRRKQLQGI